MVSKQSILTQKHTRKALSYCAQISHPRIQLWRVLNFRASAEPQVDADQLRTRGK